jgi:hypothetical protein
MRIVICLVILCVLYCRHLMIFHLEIQSVQSRELLLIGIMAAIFNGAGGLVSLPYILNLHILPLPQLIAPVGLLVLVGSLLFLRQTGTDPNRKVNK